MRLSLRQCVIVLAVVVAFGAFLAAWQLRRAEMVAFGFSPVGIMGTQTNLTAVVRRADGVLAEEALRSAAGALRNVDAMMSTYLDTSELSRFNAAGPGRVLPLSRPLLEVLRVSREIAVKSHGAFDVTVRPVLQLWQRAARRNRLPAREELLRAMGRTGWRRVRLREAGAEKLEAGAQIDLGGIAKGYAIDLALEAMRKAGCDGALVDVGGDVRCFGSPAGGGKWRVGIHDPFDSRSGKLFATLAIRDAAVCTSGNYQRFFEISGRRFSHIIDPRTGQPADAAPSVTVAAPSAMIADAWATALSVLGPDGFELLPEGAGIEAMIVTGDPEDFRIHTTAGFDKLFIGERPLSLPLPRAGPSTSPISRQKSLSR